MSRFKLQDISLTSSLTEFLLQDISFCFWSGYVHAVGHFPFLFCWTGDLLQDISLTFCWTGDLLQDSSLSLWFVKVYAAGHFTSLSAGQVST